MMFKKLYFLTRLFMFEKMKLRFKKFYIFNINIKNIL